MDDDIKATARQVRGSIKEAIGMLIGDPAIEAEGAAEKAAAKELRTKADGGNKPG